jgi:hypothetical protein
MSQYWCFIHDVEVFHDVSPTEFHMPSSVSSSVVSMNLRLNILVDFKQPLFCCLTIYRRKRPIRSAYCSQIYYHASYQNRKLSVANVGSRSRVLASAMLLVSIVWNKNVWCWGGLERHAVYTKYRETRLTSSEVEAWGTKLDTHNMAISKA